DRKTCPDTAATSRSLERRGKRPMNIRAIIAANHQLTSCSYWQIVMNIHHGGSMPPRTTSTIRLKHVQLDQFNLTPANDVLGAKTESEAIDRALSFVVDESELNQVLKRSKGRTRIRKVFR